MDEKRLPCRFKSMLFAIVFQSTRIDFIKLMLDANEADPDANLEMTVDDEDTEPENVEEKRENFSDKSTTRILKHMTLKVEYYPLPAVGDLSLYQQRMAFVV